MMTWLPLVPITLRLARIDRVLSASLSLLEGGEDTGLPKLLKIEFSSCTATPVVCGSGNCNCRLHAALSPFIVICRLRPSNLLNTVALGFNLGAGEAQQRCIAGAGRDRRPEQRRGISSQRLLPFTRNTIRIGERLDLRFRHAAHHEQVAVGRKEVSRTIALAVSEFVKALTDRTACAGALGELFRIERCGEMGHHSKVGVGGQAV